MGVDLLENPHLFLDLRGGTLVLDVDQRNGLKSNETVGQVLLGYVDLSKAAFSNLLYYLIVGYSCLIV